MEGESDSENIMSSPPSLSDSLKKLFAVQGCLSTKNSKSKERSLRFDTSWINFMENGLKFCEDPVPVSKK